MNLHLTWLSIQSFRGVPKTLTLDFGTATNNTPCSLILAGDNGTGKSSIVDAIEFALQGRIGHKKGTAFIESICSLTKSGLPEIKLGLSDGSFVNRNIVQPDYSKKPCLLDRTLHQNFRVSPFVLRRADILNFIQTPDKQKQLIFLDYFKRDQESTDDIIPEEEVAILNREKFNQKNKRRDLVKKLAEKLNVLVESIPLHPNEFDNFVTKRIYGGISKKQRKALERKGVKVSKIDPDLESIVIEIRRISSEIRSLSSDLNKLQKSVPRTLNGEILDRVLTNIGHRITDSFLALSRVDFVKRIEIKSGDITTVSLTVNVHLKNGVICSPNHVLSEANLDLLALIIFVSVVRESTEIGQSKLLILDDVFQSIDSSIRLTVTDYILRELSDWQLIFTVHDRLWQNQLRDIFRRCGHSFIEREIVRWSFDEGPVILDANHDINSLLLESLKHAHPHIICSQAGLLLESICDKLSWVLPISIIRRREDKYTLGDLWPGCFKILKKTNIKNTVLEVDRWLHLRNLMGAHYNEWAISISSQEAQYFGVAVSKLFESVSCKKCGRWVEKNSQNKQYWTCKCGQISIHI